jgi:hypothetical protein
MDGNHSLHDFRIAFLAYSALLGVLLILLGIALSGLLIALRSPRDRPDGAFADNKIERR